MKSFYTLLLASMVSLSVSAQNVDADKARAAQNKALRDSLSKATEVLAYHPDSIDLRLKKAAWNIQLEQWQYAKDDLDKVLFLNNTNIAGLFYRAFVNEKLLRYNFARLDYQNLLVLVPGNFQAQLGLALLNEKDKHYTEAYDGINSPRLFQSLLQHQRGHYTFYHLHGIWYLRYPDLSVHHIQPHICRNIGGLG